MFCSRKSLITQLLGSFSDEVIAEISVHALKLFYVRLGSGWRRSGAELNRFFTNWGSFMKIENSNWKKSRKMKIKVSWWWIIFSSPNRIFNMKSWIRSRLILLETRGDCSCKTLFISVNAKTFLSGDVHFVSSRDRNELSFVLCLTFCHEEKDACSPNTDSYV